MKYVYLLATLDTKGAEAQYLRDQLEANGVAVRMVDTGCVGEPSVVADVSREEVFRNGEANHSDLVAQGDRGEAIKMAACGVAKLIRAKYDSGDVAGVISIGGSAGTTIGTSAMRQLPIGVPKLMLSTLASGQVRPYVGDKDIVMLNSVVDIAGVNRISRLILSNAAAAMSGMVANYLEDSDSDSGLAKVTGDRPLIAATMFGVTTPCVQHARSILEQAGYEVLVFHATGNGGEAMESLIRDGLIAGVLDLTTTELADELVGGILTAGPNRLTAAVEMGVPQVVSVGATDMVNFGAVDTIPEQFAGRKFYEHNPTVTLMRTTEAECAAIGRDMRSKLQGAESATCVMLPLKGVSAIDDGEQPFDDPNARQALFDELRKSNGVETLELDNHINDEAFAEAAANKLLELMNQRH